MLFLERFNWKKKKEDYWLVLYQERKIGKKLE